MVDRAARDQYAELLRHFASGRMTSRDYLQGESSISSGTSDRGIRAIADSMWWIEPEYDRAEKGNRRLPAEERSCLARWVLFLYSDREYEWPEEPFGRREEILGSLVLAGIGFLLMPLLLLHWSLYALALAFVFRGMCVWLNLRMRRFESTGRISVWPFLRSVDFDEALRHPRLLAGR